MGFEVGVTHFPFTSCASLFPPVRLPFPRSSWRDYGPIQSNSGASLRPRNEIYKGITLHIKGAFVVSWVQYKRVVEVAERRVYPEINATSFAAIGH